MTTATTTESLGALQLARLKDTVRRDGERGEFVCTSLTNEAMSVVRYRTRDSTRLLPSTAHAPHRRMEKVTGRSDDVMTVRGANMFPSQIEEQTLQNEGPRRTTSGC